MCFPNRPHLKILYLEKVRASIVGLSLDQLGNQMPFTGKYKYDEALLDREDGRCGTV